MTVCRLKKSAFLRLFSHLNESEQTITIIQEDEDEEQCGPANQRHD